MRRVFIFFTCFLFSAKIMQTECIDASLLAIFAEVQLIFCKDNAFILIDKIKIVKFTNNFLSSLLSHC